MESGWRVCERSPFRCQALEHSPIPLAATREETSHDTQQQKCLDRAHLRFLKNVHIGVSIANPQLPPLALPCSSNETARKGPVIMCASVSVDRFQSSHMNHGPLRKAPFPSRHGLSSPQYARTHYSHTWRVLFHVAAVRRHHANYKENHHWRLEPLASEANSPRRVSCRARGALTTYVHPAPPNLPYQTCLSRFLRNRKNRSQLARVLQGR